MGGIGKTALMRAINNKLQATGEFDYVIWVTVSKELNLQRIQKEIMRRLHLEFDEDDSYQGRSMQLRQFLTDKRYMLILDNLWNSIALSEIGIPTNKENRSKIAITTRMANMSGVQVCSDMKAEKIRVETLTEDEAWDLFAAKVGKEVVSRPDIEDVAKDVVKKCGGLPLAIVVVANAMRRQNEPMLWRQALRELRASSVVDFRGMDDVVFRILKLSYDDLRDEKGFIDNVDNLVDASNKGHRIIEELKSGGLLEEGTSSKNTVKMNYMFRNVALYIASSRNEGPKFLVRAGIVEGLEESRREKAWGEFEKAWGKFERISLMRNGVTELPVRPECPNLISLFLTGNPIIAVPRSFFELMPAVRVLDLSFTSITSLSISSSSLLNLRALILRGCNRLTEVPFLGQLKELQFLDIKSSGVRRLPEEMQNLVKLKKLNMYMLILDDLWNPIDLSEIGIPTNKENRSKIAITTRNANMSAVRVCSDMKAEKIRVETLTEDEAWDLFAAKVGKEVVSQPHIKDVAKDVAKKCGGLPLAIVAVAKAMEGQNKKELWQDALRALRASAPEIEGMEPQVFLPLKLSYDDLKDEEKIPSLLSLVASLNSCRLYKFLIYLTLSSRHCRYPHLPY
ncbi:hypothetical protein AAC387_Pa06g2287 [Persea americana]